MKFVNHSFLHSTPETYLKSVLLLMCFFMALYSSEKPNYALSNLSNKNGFTADEISLVTDRLRLELHRTNSVVLIEREEMSLILQEQGFQSSGACTDQTCLVEIGQLLGAQFIISGSIGKLDKIVLVNLRIINIETGTIERVVSKDVNGTLSDVLPFLGEIARELTPRSLSSEKSVGTDIIIDTAKSNPQGLTPQKRKRQWQFGSGITSASNNSKVVNNGFLIHCSYGLHNKGSEQFLTRFMFQLLTSYEVEYIIAGGGIAFGYDVIPSKKITLSPTIHGGYWYGEEDMPNYSYQNNNQYQTYEFGGISTLFEVSDKGVKFFLEPTLRFGRVVDNRSTVSISESSTLKSNTYTRFILTIGVSLHFRYLLKPVSSGPI